MKNRKYTVLVNFAKPWHVRCRSDLDNPKFIKLNNCYRIHGEWYLPVYTSNKSSAERIASSLRTISESM